MIEYRREFRRFRKSIWGALALLILLGLLLQNVAGSAYYSLVMQPSTMVTAPPVILQEGTAGTSTIYANSTSALVSVDPSGTNVKDYVDNNTSNVDSSADKGTHSNFTAQKAGPDSIYDVLSEADTGGNINDSQNFVDNNSSNVDSHAGHGTHSSFPAMQAGPDSTFDTLTEANTATSTTLTIRPNAAGDLTQWTAVGDTANYLCVDEATSDEDTTYVSCTVQNKEDLYNLENHTTQTGAISNVRVYIRAKLTAAGDDQITIEVKTGGTTYAGTTVSPTTTYADYYSDWAQNPQTASAWTWAQIDALQAGFKSVKVGAVFTGERVTQLYVIVTYTPPANYELDLEFQWTTADFDETSEYLCIYTGTMNAEALKVDVWTGSWTNIISSLSASQWNNVSIGTYLTGSTITFRFLGGTETGDTSQSSWQIDCAIIHVWSTEVNYELDLEEQWTNANYTRENEELCIYMGAFSGSENLRVDWWNTSSSTWVTIINSLTTNSWNNVSVSAYLTSSTFTIRFKGTTETGDSTPDTWQIDATLLHVWTEDFNYILKMVENHGSNWKVRLKAYDNSTLTRLTNCSIYIYDGSNSTQIVILNGLYQNQTGPWYNLNASDTEYIWMHIETSSAGTSYIYTYLEILVPNTTTYTRYIITFEIT